MVARVVESVVRVYVGGNDERVHINHRIGALARMVLRWRTQHHLLCVRVCVCVCVCVTGVYLLLLGPIGCVRALTSH